jgi:hypothetical protein
MVILNAPGNQWKCFNVVFPSYIAFHYFTFYSVFHVYGIFRL